MGDMPLMTNMGTFVVNGTERVIACRWTGRSCSSIMTRVSRTRPASSRLQPGLFPIAAPGSISSSMLGHRARPHRPSSQAAGHDAVDGFDSDATAQKRLEFAEEGGQLPPEQAVGMSIEDILGYFSATGSLSPARKKAGNRPRHRNHAGRQADTRFGERENGDVVAEAGDKLAPVRRRLEEEGLTDILVHDDELYGRYFAEDIINEATGEIYVEAGDEIDEEILITLGEAGVKSFGTLAIDHNNIGPYIRNTLTVDKNRSREEALMDIYRVMRPGEPPTLETAEAMFQSLFFDAERYDLRRRPSKDERASRRGRRRHAPCAAARGHLPSSKRWLALKTAAARLTISIISQPACPLCRRADGKSVSDRFVAVERAIRERMSRSIWIRYAARFDQCKNRLRRVRVFRFVAAAVHGPDQPAQRDHTQAASSALGPGGLTRERAGSKSATFIRPITAALSDRDPGGPEYRPINCSPPMRGSTSTASSKRRTEKSRAAA